MKIITIATLVLCTGLGAVHAKEASNKDAQNKKTPAEQKMTIERLFNSLDQNSDEKLSLQEYIVTIKAAPNLSEQAKSIKDRFKTMDANNDSFVTLDEMRNYWRKQAQNASANKALTGKKTTHRAI